MEVAIKVTCGEGASQVRSESKLLKSRLRGKCDCYVDFPEVLWQGCHDNNETQVLQLLGPTLLDLFYEYHQVFSDKTLCLLAHHLLSALQSLHSKGYLHRDIKPDNICIANCSELYLIDFGLARKYRRKGKHLACESETHFQGNCYWTSTNILRGMTASRRDDLESLLYVLLYFSKGTLPWYSSLDHSHCSPSTILERRGTLSITQMCVDAMPVLITALAYVKTLDYTAEPKYEYLQALFRDYASANGIIYDDRFDWEQRCLVRGKERPIEDKDLSGRTTASVSPISSNRRKRASSGAEKGSSSSRSLSKKLSALNSCASRSPGKLFNRSNSPCDTGRPTEARSSGDIPRYIYEQTAFSLDLRPIQCPDLMSTPKTSTPLCLHTFRKRYLQYKSGLNQ
jgi:serine/threonine protein kinase